jgi:hypothetical protein
MMNPGMMTPQNAQQMMLMINQIKLTNPQAATAMMMQMQMMLAA